MKWAVAAAIFAVLTLAGCNGSQPTCPTCPEPIVCPAPTACPLCPDPATLLNAHLLSEKCTGAKLYMEVAEISEYVDAGDSEQFFNQNCQGVTLLEGSWFGSACSAGGSAITAAISLDQGGVAAEAATLVERYCGP